MGAGGLSMAPLLLALLPFLLLPSLLVLLGHAAALSFTSFTIGLLLLALAAQIAIGLARLPFLCLGGIAALAAAAMPLLLLDLGWDAAAAATLAPVLGVLAGLGLWLPLRRLAPLAIAVVSLAALLALAALPAVTAETDGNLPAMTAGPGLALFLSAIGLLCLLGWRFAVSPAARLHEAALESGLAPAGIGLDLDAFRLTAILVATALAAMGGAILALGSAPVIGIAAGDWATLSLATFAMGRLGGGRFGGTLLAALPLLLLPKFTAAIAPGFGDPTLAAVLAAFVLHLVVRHDGSPAWRAASPARGGKQGSAGR